MNNQCANTYYLNQYLAEQDRTQGLHEMLNEQVLDVVQSYMLDGWDFSSTGKHTAPREISWEAMTEMDSPKACDALTAALLAEIDGDMEARGVALNEFALAALQGAMDYLRSTAQTDVEEKHGVDFDLDDYTIEETTQRLERKRYQHTMISGVKLNLDVCCLDGEYTIWQVMPDDSLNEVFLSSVELAKVIAEFKESQK